MHISLSEAGAGAIVMFFLIYSLRIASRSLFVSLMSVESTGVTELNVLKLTIAGFFSVNIMVFVAFVFSFDLKQ